MHTIQVIHSTSKSPKNLKPKSLMSLWSYPSQKITDMWVHAVSDKSNLEPQDQITTGTSQPIQSVYLRDTNEKKVAKEMMISLCGALVLWKQLKKVPSSHMHHLATIISQ